ncbi:DUF3189 family protein [Halalkalibacter okhensis]|uniref:ABC transporter n=1 Tax=Halalkalibacter okhensis TaxID=333138 RepID=A0A0B0IGD3_9BACI|nr:DUF3189 family protein [Halalkalibacter okhensis]KHF39902.1 ABC transporter [Halalkalibacter okhensis]
MIYIYNCYAGTHSSALCAAYHLNKIPNDRIPTKEEILGIDIFNKLTSKSIGKLIYHGMDEEDNQVFTLGRGLSHKMITAISELLLLLEGKGYEHEKVICSNASPTVPLEMTFGGLFSHKMHIDFVGIPLLVKGAQRTYPNISKLVKKTKQVAKNSTNSIEVLENKELEVSKISNIISR